MSQMWQRWVKDTRYFTVLTNKVSKMTTENWNSKFHRKCSNYKSLLDVTFEVTSGGSPLTSSPKWWFLSVSYTLRTVTVWNVMLIHPNVKIFQSWLNCWANSLYFLFFLYHCKLNIFWFWNPWQIEHVILSLVMGIFNFFLIITSTKILISCNPSCKYPFECARSPQETTAFQNIQGLRSVFWAMAKLRVFLSVSVFYSYSDTSQCKMTPVLTPRSKSLSLPSSPPLQHTK